ncbi:MAG: hypothetical protein Ct9H300mP23_10410 [Nitrospinota bacterium]|nr:MAG: hypothetical protein Ct9H300mP23_10410 [Nitrospinota bacterium]
MVVVQFARGGKIGWKKAIFTLKEGYSIDLIRGESGVNYGYKDINPLHQGIFLPRDLILGDHCHEPEKKLTKH